MGIRDDESMTKSEKADRVKHRVNRMLKMGTNGTSPGNHETEYLIEKLKKELENYQLTFNIKVQEA